MKPTKLTPRQQAEHAPMRIRYSKRDDCFVGRCPALFFGGVHGGTYLGTAGKLIRVIEEHCATKK